MRNWFQGNHFKETWKQPHTLLLHDLFWVVFPFLKSTIHQKFVGMDCQCYQILVLCILYSMFLIYRI